MIKSNLNCIVSSCAYNNDGYCYASHIKINGYDAINSKDKNCETYVKGSFESLSSKSDEVITNSQNISCSAKNCTYNFYGGCNADHVLISTRDSKCDTFRIKN